MIRGRIRRAHQTSTFNYICRLPSQFHRLTEIQSVRLRKESYIVLSFYATAETLNRSTIITA